MKQGKFGGCWASNRNQLLVAKGLYREGPKTTSTKCGPTQLRYSRHGKVNNAQKKNQRTNNKIKLKKQKEKDPPNNNDAMLWQAQIGSATTKWKQIMYIYIFPHSPPHKKYIMIQTIWKLLKVPSISTWLHKSVNKIWMYLLLHVYSHPFWAARRPGHKSVPFRKLWHRCVWHLGTCSCKFWRAAFQ